MELLQTLDQMPRPWPTVAKGIELLEPEITKSLLRIKLTEPEEHQCPRADVCRHLLRIADWRISVGHPVATFEKYYLKLFVSPYTSMDHYSLTYSISYNIIDDMMHEIKLDLPHFKVPSSFMVGKSLEKFYDNVSMLLSQRKCTPTKLSELLNQFGE
jgi:hypothetical protein